MASYSYVKVSLLKAYIAVFKLYKFNIICISETCLDSSVASVKSQCVI